MFRFDFINEIEMRVLGRNTQENVGATEATGLMLPQPPLSRTHLTDTITINGDACALTNYTVQFQCGATTIGQSLLEYMTDNPYVVGGLTSSQLDGASAVGTMIGCGGICAGSMINMAASRTQNPTLRMVGMATADACVGGGLAVVTTPASVVVGAAALGTPLTTAALTTGTLAWLTALPLSFAGALCIHRYCCRPKPEQVYPATTTRWAQYSAINAARVARSAPHAGVMGEGGNPPPSYHSINRGR